MSINKAIRPVIASIALLVLAGCATSGQTFAQMQASAMAVDASMGRIYVYRASSAFGAAIQPSVRLDGMVIGNSVPGGYFYVDRAPGDYKVSTETEVDRAVSFNLQAGQVRYIRTDPSFGFAVGHISPVLVENAKAEVEIKNTHYTGK